MTKELTTLLALLRRAVFGKALPPELADRCTPEHMEAVFALARKHDQAHLAALALEELPLPECEILHQFRAEKKRVVIRYVKLDYEFEQICRILETAKIPYVPLKGSVLRPLYPEPWMRTSCDIDVLVPETELDRAVEALKVRGWQVRGGKNYHDISLFSPKGVHLELHFNIKETIWQMDGLLEKVWDYCEAVPGKTCEYRQTGEFLMFHIVAHMAYHFLRGGCGIRSLVDLRVLQEKLCYDETRLRQMCRQCGLEQFYENLFRLVENWFGTGTHNDVTLAMEQVIVTGGTYGSFANKVSLRNAQEKSQSAHIFRRIFMPYAKLSTEYRILETKPWLTPVCQVLRWLRLLSPQRLRHSLRELSMIRQGKGEQISEDQKLLKEIGLYGFE